MSWTMAAALYVIIWWVCLFAVLPFGVRTQADSGEITQGTPESAPSAPRLARVAAITTGVAAVVFAIVWLALRFRLVPLDLATR
jgi:predicted secreted protein